MPPLSVPVLVAIGVLHVVSPGAYSVKTTDPEGEKPPVKVAESETLPPAGTEPDGVVEMTSEAHAAILREKDFGAYDGRSWRVRSPRSDGSIAERCTGPCDDPALSDWLDQRLAR